MQTYVALLRGINVGGNRKVEMARLRQTLEALRFNGVRTLIASGNVVFRTDIDQGKLVDVIEAAIEEEFGFRVDVMVLDMGQMKKLVEAIPPIWINDKATKCDVMFLWPAADSPKVLEKFQADPKIEDVRYLPGVVLWRIDRDKASKSRVPKLAGTPLYKQLTIRNPNTVRKIYQAMLEDSN